MNRVRFSQVFLNLSGLILCRQVVGTEADVSQFSTSLKLVSEEQLNDLQLNSGSISIAAE